MAPPPLLQRLASIADEPSDTDDERLRKRVGVVAGIVTVFAPLTVVPIADFRPPAWLLGVGLSAFSVANLTLLARTHRFERYVVALISGGVVFVPLATVLTGGVTGAGSGLAWAFLVPAYGLLALGPSRSTAWFLAWIAVVVLIVAIDPLARASAQPTPYEQMLFGQAFSIVVPLSITFLLLRYTDARRRAAEARADELLTNAIPASIATRLRHGEDRIAETYPETTVLFADIVGFTPWAGATDPAVVVDVLDRLFSRFDALVADAGVEKIKTIGDSYMAAAGVPDPRPDHAAVALQVARGMLDAVDELRALEGIPLEVRIGLASGPVVAGVIGRRRILFDLWGDTVNTAARMESTGVPGRIQLTAATRRLLGDGRGFEARSVEVKGLGPMTTYLVADEARSMGQ